MINSCIVYQEFSMKWLVFSRLILLLIVICSSFVLSAQDSFQPDRPGFSTGTYTLPKGEVYLEVGYLLSIPSSQYGSTIHSLPQSNIRFGLAPKLELNLMWDGFSKVIGEKGFNAFDSFGVGAKFRVVYNQRFNLSLLGIVTSSEDLSINPVFGVLWDYSLSEPLDLFGVVHLAHSKSNGVFSELSLGLAYSITSKISVFTEYFNSIGLSSQFLAHNGSVGATYLITNNLQLDIFYEKEISPAGYNNLGAGLSKRF